MNTLPTRLVKVDDYKGVICICFHCGTKFGSANGVCSNFCAYCKRADQRAAMDEENQQIWAKDGKEFHCAYCEAIKAQKEVASLEDEGG